MSREKDGTGSKSMRREEERREKKKKVEKGEKLGMRNKGAIRGQGRTRRARKGEAILESGLSGQGWVELGPRGGPLA